MRLMLVLLLMHLMPFAQSQDIVANSTSGSESCPVQVVKMTPSHESVLNNLATMRTYVNKTVSAHNKFLEVKVRNESSKTIRGIKFVTAYYDATEDLTTIDHVWGLHDGELQPGQTGTGNWDTNKYQRGAAVGWVILPLKILYTDGTSWQQQGNDCSYEWWKDKKHPRVNKVPNLDGVPNAD